MEPAVFSPDGRYRYSLARRLGLGEGICVFIMLNPSTADAVQNDPTVRRCIGYARGWGCGTLIVANIFALRSTDPQALCGIGDPVGPDNDYHILEAARQADVLVCAWGNWGKLLGRSAAVMTILRDAGIRLGLEPKNPARV